MEFDLSREWLETNGIGGFASSTVIGCNTRRYHALLCAATRPPLGRMVLVNKADETLGIGGRQFELGCNEYPAALHPHGYQYLREFTPTPLPRWLYVVSRAASGAAQDVVLEKTLWMPHGENRTVILYTLLSGEAATLSVRPFVTGRDYHYIHRYNQQFNTHCARQTDRADTCHVTMQPYADSPSVTFSLDGDFRESGAWYYSFQYAIEQERGLEFEEDAYCPGAFVWRLTAGQSATLVIGTEAPPLDYAIGTRDREIARRAGLSDAFQVLPEDRQPHAARLALAADQFIVRRASDGLHTVLAGYPWFSDWGRDTMIALPGLCLTTQRFDEAASILRSFANAASEGMIPNRFPDHGETPDYNTVDATLWFFHAAALYVERSGDWKTVEEALYPVLRDCIEWHIKGTRYGIQADPTDGLLRSGEAGTQLTWMDAKVGDWVVTPRTGKPVEIQALWFNALRTMMEFADHQGDEATKALCGEWSRKVKAHFHSTYWNGGANCLYDYVDGGYQDGAVRPNQIFAVSLPHRLLSHDYETRVVATVQRDLLTPYGLRSLSPHDSRFCGIYEGNQWHRDGAYHQGTVWGWLIGPFLSAYLKVHHSTPTAKAQVREWLAPLLAHLDEACVGSISEIFDGNPPHTPRGCCAQAWSVAEVLRVLVEEL